MKNARPKNSRTSAKYSVDDMPPRLTGQAIQQPSEVAIIEDMPPHKWPAGFKPKEGKRTLWLMWSDLSSLVVPIPPHQARFLPLSLGMTDLTAAYNHARSVWEHDWQRGRKC